MHHRLPGRGGQPGGGEQAGVELAHGRPVQRPGLVVHGATHSWMLQDPETLPAIVRELLEGALGAACARAVLDAGLDPAAPLAAVDDAFAPAGTLLRLLGPPDQELRAPPAPRPPHYRWTRTRFPVPGGPPP